MKKVEMLKKMIEGLKEAEKIASYLSDEAFNNWEKYGKVRNDKNEDYIEEAEILGGILNALDDIDIFAKELEYYFMEDEKKGEI